MSPKGRPDRAPARCTSDAQARAQAGHVCTVVGTYALQDFSSKKGNVVRTWPVVRFAEGQGSVALESMWDESKLPAPAEIERWKGRKVEVTGMLHLSPPSADHIANLSQLTLSPVDAIRELK